MKKTVLLLLAICLVLGTFMACSPPANTEAPSNVEAGKPEEQTEAPQTSSALPPSTSGSGGNSPSSSQGAIDFDAIAEQLVVHQYSYINSIKTPWAFLVIENTSEHTLSISANLKTYNASGDLNGAKDSSVDAVPPGQMTILTYMFDEEFATSEYEISVSEETWYTPVTQNLSYESSSASKKEIVTVTNNGDIAASFVEAHVLFFQDDAMVYYDSAYFTDDDYEIKPGKSISKELRSLKDYNSFIVVFTGRGA